jgi:hypothetical protein
VLGKRFKKKGRISLNEKEVEEFLKEHPEMAGLVQFVARRLKNGQVGYWRIIPYTYFDPHPNQLKTWIALAETAYKNWGVKGLEHYKGKMIPHVAARNAEALKGKKFKKPTFEETLKKLKRLAKTIEISI